MTALSVSQPSFLIILTAILSIYAYNKVYASKKRTDALAYGSVVSPTFASPEASLPSGTKYKITNFSPAPN